jgi:hypothetical protein
MDRKRIVLVIAVSLIVVCWSGSVKASSFTAQASAPIQATATVVPSLGVETADPAELGLVQVGRSAKRSDRLLRLFHPQQSSIFLTLETADRLIGEFSYAFSADVSQQLLEILEQLPYQSLVRAHYEVRSDSNGGTLEVTIIYTEN